MGPGAVKPGPGTGAGLGLLERDSELARIDAALDDALAGRGRLLLISGEPGIGKTALLDSAREAAGEREMRVLRARGSELERDHPFGTVRQLFDPLLREARGKRRQQLLDGVDAALAALGPHASPDQEGVASEFAIRHGLWWLVANLADERPLLLAIDDAHWADRPSLRFVQFLEPRLEGLSALALLSARSSELETTGFLFASSSDPGFSALEPAPLSPAACAALIAQRFDRPAGEAFCEACRHASGGNPFYLRALIDELERERIEPADELAGRVRSLGPRTVARALAARLGRLDAAAGALARALTVLGDGAQAAQLAELAGVERDAVATLAQDLADQAILARDRELRFAHPIIRNAVYADIAASERDRLHRRAARLLEGANAPAERIAAQLLACEPHGDDKAAALLEAAAREALARGGPEPAVAYLRRALEETSVEETRRRVLVELGAAELRTDGAAAIEHLREAHAHAAEPVQRARLASLLVRALFLVRRWPEAFQAATQALEEGEGLDEETRRQLEAIALECTVLDAHAAPERDAMLKRVGRPTNDRGLGARLLLGVLALDGSRRLTAPASEINRQAQEALSGGLLLERDDTGIGFVSAVVALTLGDPEAAAGWLETSIVRARAQGDILALSTFLILRGWAHLERGDLPSALLDGRDGIEAARRWGNALAAPWGYGYLALTQLELGELEAARRTLDLALAPGADPPHQTCWLPYLDARSLLLALSGAPEASLRVAYECAWRCEEIGARNPAYLPWRSRAAMALTKLGQQREHALALAADEVELARQWGAPRALGHALWTQGVVLSGTAGEESLREAVSVLEGSPARLEHARALTALGASLRRSGSRREARPPLRQALELARECGATPLAERAHQELRATGASPPKLTRTGADMLTASERRVAQLAASGMTNKQIAQELFVTLKTVEAHLAHAYRKLDISSRNELIAALGDARDAPDRSAADGASFRV